MSAPRRAPNPPTKPYLKLLHLAGLVSRQHLGKHLVHASLACHSLSAQTIIPRHHGHMDATGFELARGKAKKTLRPGSVQSLTNNPSPELPARAPHHESHQQPQSSPQIRHYAPPTLLGMGIFTVSFSFLQFAIRFTQRPPSPQPQFAVSPLQNSPVLPSLATRLLSSVASAGTATSFSRNQAALPTNTH